MLQRPGPAPLLDEELARELAEYLAEDSMDAAARQLGLHPKTVYRWVREARDGNPPYAQLMVPVLAVFETPLRQRRIDQLVRDGIRNAAGPSMRTGQNTEARTRPEKSDRNRRSGSGRLRAISVPQHRELTRLEEHARTAAKPVSTQQVPLNPALIADFKCDDCDSDIDIPQIIRKHDPTCPSLKGVT